MEVEIKTRGSFPPLCLPAKLLHESTGSPRAAQGQATEATGPGHAAKAYRSQGRADTAVGQKDPAAHQCQGSLRARNTVSCVDWGLG